MNPPPSSYEPLPAGERFVDAALSEHARLGKDGRDAELIHRVLLETVHRQPNHLAAPRTAAWGRSMWFVGAAAVAALFTLAFATLFVSRTDPRERPSEELHFTVRFLEPSPGEEATPRDVPAPQVGGDLYSGAIPFHAPAPPSTFSASVASANYELITTMGPSFEFPPAPGSRREDFRITADESLASSDRRLYQGHVVVEHALFRIEAGEVSVPAPGRTRSAGTSPPLFATDVTVTQEAPRRVARAKNLRFDPLTGALVLTGVESLATDEGRLVRFAPGDQLVLNGEGFSVESPVQVKYVAPENVSR